jgi:hypothetical protein
MRNSDLLPEGVFPKAYFEKSFRTILGPDGEDQTAKKLHMKEGGVDDYITEFEDLARSAGYSLAIPSLSDFSFAGSHPSSLRACIDSESTETSDKWAAARQQPLIR